MPGRACASCKAAGACASRGLHEAPGAPNHLSGDASARAACLRLGEPKHSLMSARYCTLLCSALPSPPFNPYSPLFPPCPPLTPSSPPFPAASLLQARDRAAAARTALGSQGSPSRLMNARLQVRDSLRCLGLNRRSAAAAPHAAPRTLLVGQSTPAHAGPRRPTPAHAGPRRPTATGGRVAGCGGACPRTAPSLKLLEFRISNTKAVTKLLEKLQHASVPADRTSTC